MMFLKRSVVLLIAVAFVLIYFALSARALGEPLPSFDFSQAPYSHNMQFTATAPSQVTYSGRYMVHTHQWGAFVLNVDTGAFRMISPVGKYDPSFQSPQFPIIGDCWQSGVSVGVSPFNPKWVVLTGAPQMCSKRCDVRGVPGRCEPRIWPDEVQVMRLDPPGFRFVGSVNADSVDQVRSNIIIIEGDVAYIREGAPLSPPYKFTKIDLNALTVLAEHLATAPPQVFQTSVDGYTWTIAGIRPNPLPNPWPGFKNFRVTRSDVVIPTVPAPPTVTAGPPTPRPGTPTKTPTRRASPGPVPCDTIPGGPICTPTRAPSAAATKTNTPAPTATASPAPTIVATAAPSPSATKPPNTPSPRRTSTPLPDPTAPPAPTVPPATPTPKPGRGCGGALALEGATAAAAIVVFRKRRPVV